MSFPKLTFQVDWTSGVVGKLSTTPPFNCCDVVFSSDQHLQKFKARATFEDAPTGLDRGVLVTEMSDVPQETQTRFTLNGDTCLTMGDGTYIISLYAQNDAGEWNTWRLFITYDNKKFKTISEEQMLVKEE